MKKTRKSAGIQMTLRFLLSVIVIFGMLMPLAASGESRKSNGNYWPDNVTTIYFRYDDEQFSYSEISEIQRAFHIWNNANSMDEADILQVHKRYLYLTAGTSDNLIAYPPVWNYDFDWPGYCEPSYVVGRPGELDHVQILLNSAQNISTNVQSGSYHLASVVVHEAGHALGIAHCHASFSAQEIIAAGGSAEGITACRSATCLRNVMNPNLKMNDNRTTLQPYDYSSYFIANQ